MDVSQKIISLKRIRVLNDFLKKCITTSIWTTDKIVNLQYTEHFASKQI